MHPLHPLLQTGRKGEAQVGATLSVDARPRRDEADARPAEHPAPDSQLPLAALIERALLTASQRADAERAAQQPMVARNAFD